MKAVMISIQPKWVEKILNGEKTIEVRKTCPNLKPPFKCYIYCTNDRKITLNMANGRGLGEKGELYLNGNCYYPYTCGTLNGKVIGEFICDRIYKIKDSGWQYLIENDIALTNRIARESCLLYDDLRRYLGTKDGYGWHISDLKIYDKPKEISEFWTVKCNHKAKSCGECDYKPKCVKTITRAPQSWCYVEEVE